MFDGTTGCVMEFHGTGIAQVVGGKGCAGRGQYADHSQKQGKFLHHRIHPFFYFFFSFELSINKVYISNGGNGLFSYLMITDLLYRFSFV